MIFVPANGTPGCALDSIDAVRWVAAGMMSAPISTLSMTAAWTAMSSPPAQRKRLRSA